ncbi:MAG: tetratricopeptide repeat protein [Gallionella sp.]
MTPNRQSQLLIAGVVFLTAVAARLLVALELSHTPFFDIYVGDSLYYHEWALRLIAGKGNDTVFFQAPLYPYFLGALYRIFSPDPWVPRIAQTLLAGAGCVLLSLSAYRLFGRRAGWMVGLLAALYTPSLFYDLLVHKSGIALFLGSLIIFFIARFLTGNRSVLTAAVIGSVTALAAMAIEQYLMILPVMGAWMLMYPKVAWQQRIRWVTGLLIGVFLIQMPVIARNYWVARDPVFSSASAGMNFWIGNGKGANGHYREISSDLGNIKFEQSDSMRIASIALNRQVSGSEASRWWFDRTFHDIAAQPVAWLKVMVQKAGLVLSDSEWPDEEAYGAYVPESRILSALGVVVRFGLLLPLFVIGAIALWNRKEESRPIIASSIAILGGVMLFFVFGRYRYAAMPFMFVVAGSGAAALSSMMAWKARWTLLGITGITASAIAFLPLDTRYNESFNYYYLVGERAFFLNRYDLAKDMMLRTIPSAPNGWAAPYNLLARVYWKTGQWDLAEANMRKVIALQPDFPEAHSFLGNMLVRVGDVRNSRGDMEGAKESYAEARAELKIAISLYSYNEGTRYLLGSLMEKTASPQEMVAYYRKAIALDPKPQTSNYYLAVGLEREGKFDQAIGILRHALEIDPAHEMSQNRWGTILEKQNRLTQALDHYLEAVEIHPEYKEAQENCARVLERLSRPAEAEKHRQLALTSDFNTPRRFFYWGRYLVNHGRYSAAIAELRKALQVNPEDSEAKQLLSLALEKSG